MASRPKAAAVDKAGGDSLCSDGVVSAPLSDEPGDIDAWSLMEPTDVIAKMRKDFYELAASKKWQERKEAMESLLSIMESAPRVALSPDLQQVIVTLTKILEKDVNINILEKDVNINVSSICVKVLTKLAESMRTDFAAMVPKALLESYSEAICGGLTKPNPQSRAQTAQFTSRLFSRHSSSTIPVEAVKQIVPELIKCCSDADAEVRESTFRAMGAITRCVGETAARRLFGEVAEDKIKMGKVRMGSRIFSNKV
ncbi:unnamed protein product [Strongylus vulgaris]|uniref:TOG domain-containing protein n=1 Tax=Strongylus vulgaris TaxID=40348 RepID=A0A3P7J986_STRVU|nr:unnamed protein product [Strongylus vulgaris]